MENQVERHSEHRHLAAGRRESDQWLTIRNIVLIISCITGIVTVSNLVLGPYLAYRDLQGDVETTKNLAALAKQQSEANNTEIVQLRYLVGQLKKTMQLDLYFKCQTNLVTDRIVRSQCAALRQELGSSGQTSSP